MSFCSCFSSAGFVCIAFCTLVLKSVSTPVLLSLRACCFFFILFISSSLFVCCCFSASASSFFFWRCLSFCFFFFLFFASALVTEMSDCGGEIFGCSIFLF